MNTNGTEIDPELTYEDVFDLIEVDAGDEHMEIEYLLDH